MIIALPQTCEMMILDKNVKVFDNDETAVILGSGTDIDIEIEIGKEPLY